MKIIHSLHAKKNKKKKKKGLYRFFIFIFIILFFVFSVACCVIFYLYTDFIRESNISNVKEIQLDGEKTITLYQSNNKIEEIKKEIIVIEKEKIDEYKDYEKNLLKLTQKNFIKPFNYKEESFCSIKINILTKEYKIEQCNSDAIFKRNLELSLIKSLKIYQMPIIGKNNKEDSLYFNFQLVN